MPFLPFASVPASSPLPPVVPLAQGARIKEGEVKRTLVVPSGQHKTLRSAFQAAHGLLVKGIPVKIQLRAGVYRETVAGLDWTKGKARDTLLVIEGQGSVRWTGADVFPLAGWKREGPLLVHPWPHQFGNFAYSWSAKGQIGHRSEMAFFQGRPLRPVVLERYKVEGIVQNPEYSGTVSHSYQDTLDPAQVLKPGEFGVMEREGSRRSVFVRLPEGASAGPDSLEVSVRRILLDLRQKNKVVLRGITFDRTANSDADYGSANPVRFSAEEGKRSSDVLLDRVRILWNAHTGLHLDGERWTVKDSEFSFNGGSGIATGKSSDVLWLRNKTNFNVWRLWRAGELGYYTGGFKAHEIVRHTILGHEAVGNCTMGAWWDIQCADVMVRDLVAVGNGANLQFEISPGPFVAERILLAGGKAGDGQLRLWEHGHSHLHRSILYTDHLGSGVTGLYNLRWFGRTDGHATMGVLKAGVNHATENIFMAGPKTAQFGLFDDIRGREWFDRNPMSYRGRNNVFWAQDKPDFPRRWILDGDRKGELAARAYPVTEWLAGPHYSEENLRTLNPHFVDPARYDFRFKPESPFYGQRSQYPQYRMSEALHKEWAWFTQWSGYLPEVWNEPPGF